MIGAGVFAAFAPAARAAGTGLLVGLAVAAVVAYCNATASAQLAAAYPRAGGTYLYGREVLGDWWGFLAGWGFVVGKTAQLRGDGDDVRGVRRRPTAWQRPVAAAVVVVLALVNCAGITRTAGLTRIIVALVLISLASRSWPLSAAVTAQGLGGLGLAARRCTASSSRPGCCSSRSPATRGSPRSARRCASPSGSSRARSWLALAGAVVVYAVVGVAVLSALGPEALAASTAAARRRRGRRSPGTGPSRSSGSAPRWPPPARCSP